MKRERLIATILGKSAFTQDDKREIVRLLAFGVRIDTVVELLLQNKVGATARKHLAKIVANGANFSGDHRAINSLIQALDKPETGAIELRRTELRRAIENASRRLADAGLPAIVIKGGSYLLVLPDYSNRHTTDVDFVFPDLRALWSAVRVLTRHGYIVDERETAWLRNYVQDGVALQGHVALKDPQDGIKLDLHSHNMSAGPSLLRCDLFGRARSVSVGSARVLVPSPEDSLLIIAAHGFSHGFFTMKDLNDIVEILRACGTSLDWTYVADFAQFNALGDIIAYLNQRLRTLYGVGLPVSGQSRSLAMRRALQLSDAIAGKPTVWRLALVYAISDFQYDDNRSFIDRFISFWHWLFWSAVTGLRAEHKVPEWADRRLALREQGPYFPQPPFSYPIFLAPLESTGDIANIEWDENQWTSSLSELLTCKHEGTLILRNGPDELVLTPGGLFVPTKSMVFSDNHWSRLEEFGRHVIGRLRASNRTVEVDKTLVAEVTDT